jgi:hypothetical protein
MARWIVRITLCGWLAMSLAASAQSGAGRWWTPGDGTPLPEFITYANDGGSVGVLNSSGPLDTKSHPFFEPIGTNGRHVPSAG